MKLDLEYKDEKIDSLNKEIEELSAGGASEEEVTILKRQKNDLENRLKDQEEELDDLAGQVQMLEAAKTKLEMSMAAIKKEHRYEHSQNACLMSIMFNLSQKHAQLYNTPFVC